MTKLDSSIAWQIEVFDGRNDFREWQGRVMDSHNKELKKNSLWGLSENHTEDLNKWEGMEERAMSFIQLNFSDEMLLDVMDEETTPGLWVKLGSLCMIADSSHEK